MSGEQRPERHQHQRGDHAGDHDQGEQPRRGPGIQADQGPHRLGVLPPRDPGAHHVQQHPRPQRRRQQMRPGEHGTPDRDDVLRVGPHPLRGHHREQWKDGPARTPQPQQHRGGRERGDLDGGDHPGATGQQPRYRQVREPGRQASPAELQGGQDDARGQAEQRCAQRPRVGQRHRRVPEQARQTPSGQPAEGGGQSGEQQPARHRQRPLPRRGRRGDRRAAQRRGRWADRELVLAADQVPVSRDDLPADRVHAVRQPGRHRNRDDVAPAAFPRRAERDLAPARAGERHRRPHQGDRLVERQRDRIRRHRYGAVGGRGGEQQRRVRRRGGRRRGQRDSRHRQRPQQAARPAGDPADPVPQRGHLSASRKLPGNLFTSRPSTPAQAARARPCALARPGQGVLTQDKEPVSYKP